ncbi:MAG: TldD/PmbA family protein [Bacteroidales bacterium]
MEKVFINKTPAREALKMIMEMGADAVNISYSEEQTVRLSLLNGELDHLQSSGGASMYFQIFVDHKYGTFSTNKMEKRELEPFLRKAIESTRFLTEDACRTLPDKDRYYKAKSTDPDLKQFDENYEDISIEMKEDFLREVASKIDSNDKRLVSSTTEYEDSFNKEFIIDSQGFEGTNIQTYYAISTECSILAEDGSRPQNWWYNSAIRFKDLKKDSAVKAFDRTVSMVNGKTLESGKYTTVIENVVSNQLVSPIIQALNGNAIQQKVSFLQDKLGEQVFPESVTLSDNPFEVGAMGARYFDDEGVATKSRKIIDKGVLTTYFINTYVSNKLSIPATIEGISIPELSPLGKSNKEEIIKEIGTGILITGFNGGNCNGSTGDFSYGIEGYYFVDGKIVEPVKEMNMTGNIVNLWHDIRHIGSDFRSGCRWRIPTLAFDNVNINGK